MGLSHKTEKEKIAREEWASVDGRRVRLLVAPPEPGDAEPDLSLPVLFLHGLGCTAEVWRPTLEELHRRGLCCPAVAPDLPGFGKSAGPRGALGMEELADWAVRLLDARGLNRVHAVGNSMGCQVGMALARRHPDRVGGLILQGPTTGERLVPMWRYTAGLLADAFAETPAYNARLLVMYGQMGPMRYLRTVRRMMEDDPFEHAGDVKAPTLVIRGGHDLIVSDRVARKLAAALPDAVYTPFDSAAHAIEFNHPEEFAGAMVTFLTRAEERLGMREPKPDGGACAYPPPQPKAARARSNATATAVSNTR